MKRKTIITVISIVVVLVAIRLALPTFVEKYVNNVLSDLEGYQGKIEDVDLNLYRGAYVIDEITIEKLKEKNPVPFIYIKRMDLSVDWNAIFKGAIVGDVTLIHPKLNFTTDEQDSGDEKVKEKDSTNWLETLKDLMPLTINEFVIENGELSFLNFSSEPQVDLSMNDIQLTALNISNVEDKTNTLPSTINANTTSIGGGALSLDMKMNFLKEIPDVDADLSFENVDLPALNDFFKVYGNFDVEKGSFNVYTEVTINDGNLDGYIKPIFDEVEILNIQEDIKDKNFLQTIWEGIVGLFSEGLENQQKDQVATKIPITGNLNNPDTPLWPTITNIFRNAFIEAFSKQVEGEIKFNDQT